MVTQTHQPEVAADMTSLFKVLHVNGGIVIRPRQADETPIKARAITDREKQVLSLVAEGNSNKLIGDQLYISGADREEPPDRHHDKAQGLRQDTRGCDRRASGLARHLSSDAARKSITDIGSMEMTTLMSANGTETTRTDAPHALDASDSPDSPDSNVAAGPVETRLLRMVRQEIRSILREVLADTEHPLTPAATGNGSAGQAGSTAHIAPDQGETHRPSLQDLRPEYQVPSPFQDGESCSAQPVPQEGLAATLQGPLGALALDLAEQEAQQTSGRQILEENVPSDEEQFEGTVRLTVEANGCNRQVLHFVEQVCQLPAVRLLQLVGNSRREGVDVWLGLREPACLKMVLLQIPGVADVTTPVGCSPDGHERLLVVRLA